MSASAIPCERTDGGVISRKAFFMLGLVFIFLFGLVGGIECDQEVLEGQFLSKTQPLVRSWYCLQSGSEFARDGEIVGVDIISSAVNVSLEVGVWRPVVVGWKVTDDEAMRGTRSNTYRSVWTFNSTGESGMFRVGPLPVNAGDVLSISADIEFSDVKEITNQASFSEEQFGLPWSCGYYDVAYVSTLQMPQWEMVPPVQIRPVIQERSVESNRLLGFDENGQRLQLYGLGFVIPASHAESVRSFLMRTKSEIPSRSWTFFVKADDGIIDSAVGWAEIRKLFECSIGVALDSSSDTAEVAHFMQIVAGHGVYPFFFVGVE